MRVSNPHQSSANKPKVTINAQYEEIIANTLAKAGWYAANPNIIYHTPVDKVMSSYHFEIFSREYESAYYELNKGK